MSIATLPQTDSAKRSTAPRPPVTLEETGLSADQVGQLLIKTLYTGEATGVALADRMRLTFLILQPLIEHMRSERLMELRGSGGTNAASYRYALTDLGRDRARQYLEINQYVGPAPIPLDVYVRHTKAVAVARGYIDRDCLQTGFENLIVSPETLEQLGPAVNANKAIFLYGPPGNGKTVLAEGMGRSIGTDLHIPHAVDVDGQIITVFDPVLHESLEAAESPVESQPSIVNGGGRDGRWVRIKRPVVIVGGELTLDMLDLRFNPISKYHEAPLQMKANGGLFLVDDFGRQRMRPEDLLNRWIVPLESRVDYLTLNTGRKIQVPFDVLTVFATNLDPQKLADEAFLRRIPYKIPITDPTLEQFMRIFELNCNRRNLRYHEVMVTYLHRRHYAPYGRSLRACHPRDLLDQVTALCRYRGQEPIISRDLIDAACRSYFVENNAAPIDVAPPATKKPGHQLDIH